VSRHRLVHALRLDEFDKAELDGVIAVGLLCLLLNDNAGSSLNHRHRHYCSVVLKQLRHAHFLSE
jgi:hypothetical protein